MCLGYSRHGLLESECVAGSAPAAAGVESRHTWRNAVGTCRRQRDARTGALRARVRSATRSEAASVCRVERKRDRIQANGFQRIRPFGLRGKRPSGPVIRLKPCIVSAAADGPASRLTSPVVSCLAGASRCRPQSVARYVHVRQPGDLAGRSSTEGRRLIRETLLQPAVRRAWQFSRDFCARRDRRGKIITLYVAGSVAVAIAGSVLAIPMGPPCPSVKRTYC
jgi:hypothetical protein